MVGSCSSATRVAAWPRMAGTGRSVAVPLAERANSSAVLLVRIEGERMFMAPLSSTTSTPSFQKGGRRLATALIVRPQETPISGTWPSPAMKRAAACATLSSSKPLVLLVAGLRHDDGLLQAEAALQAGLDVGAARRARHDLDAHDAALAGVGEEAARLPAGEAEFLGEVAHRHVELVIALGDLDHQELALLARKPAKLRRRDRGLSRHGRRSPTAAPRGGATSGVSKCGRLEIVDQQLAIAPMRGEVRLDRGGRLRHHLGRREQIGQRGRRRRRRRRRRR